MKTDVSSPAFNTAQIILQGLVSLVFVTAGILNLTSMMTAEIVRLGYPAYFSIIIGAAYIIGVICVYQPRFPVLRNWAFGAMAAALAGGAASHVLSGDPIVKAVPALVVLMLLVVAHMMRSHRMARQSV